MARAMIGEVKLNKGMPIEKAINRLKRNTNGVPGRGKKGRYYKQLTRGPYGHGWDRRRVGRKNNHRPKTAQ